MSNVDSQRNKATLPPSPVVIARPGSRWKHATRSESVLRGHVGHVDGALELPHGRFISWGQDKTFRLWDSDGNLRGEGGSYSYPPAS